MLYVIYGFVVTFLVAIDQYTKQLINTYVKEYEQIEIIPKFFSITNVRNTGAAWSMFEGEISIFIVITVLAIAYFAYELLKNKDNTLLFKISSLFIIAGAIGNLIDRIVNHYVVDFLDFIIIGYDFPVFNVADILLTVGVGLYILELLLEMKNAKH